MIMMRWLLGLAALAMLPVSPVRGQASSPKVGVPGFLSYPGVPAGSAEVLNDLVLEALLTRHGIHAIGPSDVRSLLSAEQQAQLLGCSEERCMVKLAGVLGAEWLVAGSVGRLEGLWVVNLMIIDTQEARVTARASESMESLAAAPAQIGPLVDRLVGSQPRYRATTAAFTKPEALPKPMEHDAFCAALRAYLERLVKAPHAAAFADERRRLLTDLMATAYESQFVRKASCLWGIHGRTQGELRGQWRAGVDDAAARDAALRSHEFDSFADQLKLLTEAYTRGLELEKNGTGRRLDALPFEVRVVSLPEPPETPAVAAYRRAYAEALPVLQEGLRLVSAGDVAGFSKLWPAPDPKLRTRSPKHMFEDLRNTLSQGYTLQACPFLVMDAQEIEYRADVLAGKGQAQLCWRKLKGSFVSTERAVLEKAGGRWGLHSF